MKVNHIQVNHMKVYQ